MDCVAIPYSRRLRSELISRNPEVFARAQAEVILCIQRERAAAGVPPVPDSEVQFLWWDVFGFGDRLQPSEVIPDRPLPAPHGFRTTEECLEAIRAAVAWVAPSHLTCRAYERWRYLRCPTAPTRTALHNHLGTWNEALDQASNTSPVSED